MMTQQGLQLALAGGERMVEPRCFELPLSEKTTATVNIK